MDALAPLLAAVRETNVADAGAVSALSTRFPIDSPQVQRVKRTLLPVNGELAVGDQFQTGPDRSDPVVTVAAIEGDDVLLDANHPLAGVDLTFDVEITAAREATPEDLSHGHAHGGGGGCGDGSCGCH